MKSEIYFGIVICLIGTIIYNYYLGSKDILSSIKINKVEKDDYFTAINELNKKLKNKEISSIEYSEKRDELVQRFNEGNLYE